MSNGSFFRFVFFWGGESRESDGFTHIPPTGAAPSVKTNEQHNLRVHSMRRVWSFGANMCAVCSVKGRSQHPKKAADSPSNGSVNRSLSDGTSLMLSLSMEGHILVGYCSLALSICSLRETKRKQRL